jgi:hypothetical protein
VTRSTGAFAETLRFAYFSSSLSFFSAANFRTDFVFLCFFFFGGGFFASLESSQWLGARD